MEKVNNMRDGKIIIVDDNEAVLKSLRTILAHEFKTIITVSSPTLLPALLINGNVDIVLLDMNFGTGQQNGREGIFWLERILEYKNPPAVILITAFGDIELAVASLKKGASDFIVKPWDNDKLINTVINVWEHKPQGINTIPEQIIKALLKKYATAYAKPFPELTPEAFRKLSDMAGRGDLSLLQQSVERALLFADSDMLDIDDFYDEPDTVSSHNYTLEEMEKQFISEVMKEKKGNLSLVAQQLDISRQTLYNKIKKYGL